MTMRPRTPKARTGPRLAAVVVVSALAALGCGRSDAQSAATGGGTASSTAMPTSNAEAATTLPRGACIGEHLIEYRIDIDTAEEVAQAADVIVVGTVEAKRIEPDESPLFDEVSDRIVIDVRVTETLVGTAEEGDVVEVHVGTRYSNPTTDHPAWVTGQWGHEFTDGDDVLLALSAASPLGERGVVGPDAFFVLQGDTLDIDLAAYRRYCAFEGLGPLWVEAEDMSRDDLVERFRALA